VVFSFHPLLIGGNPLTTTAYYCLIAHLERKFGVHYAMGGTGALVRGLVDLIEDQGGEVICNAGVDEIRVENGTAVGVTLESGERLDSAVVVSNADAAPPTQSCCATTNARSGPTPRSNAATSP
jgi:phytoene desaturase